MIDKIVIDSYRSCRGVVFDGVGPLTLLIGRNGVGKTNILKSILRLANIATSSERILPPGWSFIRDKGAIDFQSDGRTYRYVLSIETGFVEGQPEAEIEETLGLKSDDGDFRLILSRRNDIVQLLTSSTSARINRSVPCLPALATLLPDEDQESSHIKSAISFLSSVRYYAMDEIDADDSDDVTVILDESYNLWQAKHEAGSVDARNNVLLRILQLSREEPQKFEEFRELLGPNGLGLINDIIVSTEEYSSRDKEGRKVQNKFYVVRFQPSMDRGDYGFGQLSYGTRRILRILLYLISDNCSVMLLEQPEDGIHFGLLRKLMGILRTNSDQVQIIISSHSSEMFNTMDPADIRLVTMSEGTTSLRPLSADEMESAKLYMCEEGSLADFLKLIDED